MMEPPKGTTRDWLDTRAAEGGTGFVFPDGGPDLSWQELRKTAEAIARYLTAKGIAKGESIAILHPNGREALECLFGVLYGGFRATMINLVAGNSAVSYALQHSGARFAFVHPSQTDLFQETASLPFLSPLDQAAATGGSPAELHPLSAGDHALLMYTSGTTGQPKGVVHTHASLLAGGWTTAVAHELTPQDRGLCVLPIYHINGLCVTVMGALTSGGSLAMCERFSASRFWAHAGWSQATWFSVVPTIISHLLHSDLDPVDSTKARLRFGRSASSALAPDVQRAFEDRFGVPIIETMGLTETAAQILSNPLPPGIRKIGSPGFAYGNEVTILDARLQPVSDGSEGELAVRGPNVMLEYLNNPEATAATFTPDGWLRTGDLGRIDGDGYVYVTGRLKELIIKGGENIAPREIDEALYSHPDVIEAAAYGRPCNTYGETVEAAVKIRDGSSLTTLELIEICRSQLGNFKSPDEVHILDDLPKGPSGKIQRNRILEEITDRVAGKSS
ncbi:MULTISPECIES: class I adenylate-forming enzyme family protein [unclassified Leisingera]|uniref:class I adenylate-forming enzyme family protein n=1 Tax=unclassified Leisingera TaxID=2614906 RepID=UPI00030EB64E|nr:MULTISPECIES: AMP-binding protein [unclassified Leisingera]KIC23617.1 AMP-dependent synthetase [Leisingera sp. ANG-S3]KIC52188.1 AMP-dependent synthetase [Leisingera sp. ANG-S]KID09746.1 AMP-dependent synthetase [Leisingera sp. ANG1]